MFKIAFRNLWDHKLRSALLAAAIVAGVSFVVASFVFTDSLGSSFDGVFEQALDAYDISIDPAVEEQDSFGPPTEIPNFDASILPLISSLEGVESAIPSIQTFAVIDFGEVANPFGGPPTIAFSWAEGAIWELTDGRPPTNSSELTLFVGTAEENDIAIGDTLRVAFDGPVSEFEVVGTMSFGETTDLFGASFLAFDLETAEDLFDMEGQISTVAIRVTEGTDVDTLVDTINELLPDEAVAQSSQSSVEEEASDLKQGLSFFNTFLLAFSGIALVVGLFVVYNAFRVVVAQRTRELALLRILGTKRLQMITSVLFEAAIIGVVASAFGILVGSGLAVGIRKLLELTGSALPNAGLVLAPRTIAVGFTVGIVATLISATLPALRTSRISPMEALRDMPTTSAAGWISKVIGAVVLASSVGLIIFGSVAADGSQSAFTGETGPLKLVGLGGFLLFIGLYLTARFAAKPIIGFLGFRAKKMTAVLARENAIRTPRRTATTAAALMIGLGLVVMVSILSASVQDQILAATEDSVSADIFIQPGGANFFGSLPDGIEEIVSDLDGIDTATSLSLKPVELPGGGANSFLLGVRPEGMDSFLKFAVLEGSLDDMIGDGIAVQQIEVEAQGFALGDDIPITIDGTLYTFELAVIFELLGDTPDDQSYYANVERLMEIDPELGTNTVAIVLKPGILPADGKETVLDALVDYPTVSILTLDDLVGQIKALLGGIVAMIGGLLFMSVFIALIGIVLTLYLAVIERTREIGLLRAIGMSKAQVRKTIRFEAVLIALFGAVLGIFLGVFLGWGLVRAIMGEGSSMTVPWLWLVAGFAGAGIAGVLAAIFPSYNASNMNVLEAISYE